MTCITSNGCRLLKELQNSLRTFNCVYGEHYTFLENTLIACICKCSKVQCHEGIPSVFPNYYKKVVFLQEILARAHIRIVVWKLHGAPGDQ